MPGRSRRSAWVRRQAADPYVKQAQAGGYRARSAYKLEEIDRRDRLLEPGMTVIDLGAAPGAWSQYAARRVGAKGRVLALDILPMDPVSGVQFLRGDITTQEGETAEGGTLGRLEALLAGARADVVLSDMAPNLSGIRAADQARAMELAAAALQVADRHLAAGGTLLVKVFEGDGVRAYREGLRARFANVVTRKPPASRERSREHYLLARDYGINSA